MWGFKTNSSNRTHEKSLAARHSLFYICFNISNSAAAMPEFMVLNDGI